MRAVILMACRTAAVLGRGLHDNNRAAIAAACGAAADVPKNGLRCDVRGSVVETPFAPVRSGFITRRPPVDEKFPGVMGVPERS